MGLTEYEIRWNRNRDNHFIYCPKPGIEILDTILQITSSEAPLSSFKNLVPITGINLNNIPMDVIYTYLDNNKTLYGVFNNASEFALYHGLNPWKAYRYINKERDIPIEIEVDTLFIYFCCNPMYLIFDIHSKKNWLVVSIDTA